MKISATLVFVCVLISQCQSTRFSLRELQTILLSSSEELRLKNHGNGECHVVGYNAGCCQHIEVDKVDINSTICVNVTYLPSDYGLSLTLTVGRRTFINETVSARSPPALCAELPYSKEIASICLKFHDLDISKSAFKGCVKIIIDLAYVSIADYDLGCFTIPLKGQRSRFDIGEIRSSVFRGQGSEMVLGNDVNQDIRNKRKKDGIFSELLDKRQDIYNYMFMKKQKERAVEVIGV